MCTVCQGSEGVGVHRHGGHGAISIHGHVFGRSPLATNLSARGYLCHEDSLFIGHNCNTRMSAIGKGKGGEPACGALVFIDLGMAGINKPWTLMCE